MLTKDELDAQHLAVEDIATWVEGLEINRDFLVRSLEIGYIAAIADGIRRRKLPYVHMDDQQETEYHWDRLRTLLDHPHRERYVKAAFHDFHDPDGDQIEVDQDTAVISESNDGAYVQAWVWVSRERIEEDTNV